MAERMSKYDPMKAPVPSEWLALDEAERMDLIAEFHKRAGERFPGIRAHIAIHTIVETQVAMGGELPVAATLERLQLEGLNRHDAIHAIGTALAGHLHGLASGSASAVSNDAYRAVLEKLSAHTWRHAR